MSLGIYKPGQGYWVRVMSAALAGLLVAALAVWVYGQMQVLSERLPRSGYLVGLQTVPATPFQPGDAVELVTAPDAAGKTDKVATATVQSAEGRRVVVKDLQLADPKTGQATNAGVIRKPIAAGDPGALSVNIAKNDVRGIAPIDSTVLGGAGAAAVVLIGAGMAYWFIAVRPRSVEFLIATDFEMTKVNWSSPREIMGHTWVVIGACVLLAASLWIVDQALVFVFTSIDLLPHVPTSGK